MEKKGIKNIFWRIISYIFFTYICLGGIIILKIHTLVPFFPVLFFFDVCFILTLPLFLHYVLKKKWDDCMQNDYLKVKYILFPWLIMETCLMFYYFHETLIVLRQIAER